MVKGTSGLLIGFLEFSSVENITSHTSGRFTKDLLKTKHAQYLIYDQIMINYDNMKDNSIKLKDLLIEKMQLYIYRRVFIHLTYVEEK